MNRLLRVPAAVITAAFVALPLHGLTQQTALLRDAPQPIGCRHAARAGRVAPRRVGHVFVRGREYRDRSRRDQLVERYRHLPRTND